MGEIHKIQKNGVTIYPATTTDAVVDSHFKKSIIGLFNYITLDFDTSAYDTRLKIPMEYRRYGLIVGYFNSLTGKYIIEQYLNNSVFSDGTWGKDDSWINILNADDIYASAMHIRQDSFSTLQNSNNLFKFDFPKGKKLYVRLNWDNGNFVNLQTSGKEGNLTPLIQITEKNKFIEIIPSKPIGSIGYVTNSANCTVKIELYSEVTVRIAKNSDAILQKADKVDLESVRTISDMNNEIISNGYLLSNGYNNTTPAANSYGFIPFKQEKISGIKAVYLQDNAENLSDLYVVALKYNSEANFSGVRKSLLVWNPDKNRYDTDLDLEEGEYYGFMTNSAASQIKSLECYEGDTDDFSIQSASMANTILSLNSATL